jgi:hypothetical protein
LARSGEEERSNNNNAVVGGGGGGGAVKIEWVRKTKKREALFSRVVYRFGIFGRYSVGISR